MFFVWYDENMKKVTDSFQLPTRTPGISDIAYCALQLGALSSRLALEDRTLVNHMNGRPENVAEHSTMLAIVAPGIAEKYYSDLDANLVARFASIHDVVEAYVGDTTTHIINERKLREKANREAKALEQLKEDFSSLPNFVKLVEEYEAQEIPEARFVRIIDKWMPVLVHFADKGKTIHAYTHKQELMDSFAARSAQLKEQYPDFIYLVTIREELTELAAKNFFE